jgi:hypothetical protein
MKQLILLIALILTTISRAQWSSDVRLTNELGISGFSPQGRHLAVSGSMLHLVWEDDRHGKGNYEVYYKNSTNGGISWGSDIRLTNTSAISRSSTIAVSGSVIHVVWMEDFWKPVILYRRSTDGGNSWSSDMALSQATTGFRRFPTIEALGEFVHVVWHDNRSGIFEIYYKRSTDGGITWSQDIQLTNDAVFFSGFPDVAVDGSSVYVVWHKADNEVETEIYYKRSSDYGISWSENTRLTYANGWSGHPSIAALNGLVHVVWMDGRNGNDEILYKRSSDNGLTWSGDNFLTNNQSESWFPKVVASNQLIHVVWYDKRDGNYEIYYINSTNYGINWGENIRLTIDPAQSLNPSLAVSGTALHVVWHDDRDGGGYEVYYKTNPNGNQTSIEKINAYLPVEYSLSQNYPNPFNASTIIKFELPVDGFVNFSIYDILGREVEVLINEQLSRGIYEILINANDLASGIYYYRLKTREYTQIRKMVLLK